jgi:LacI family transcriptional regulator
MKKENAQRRSSADADVRQVVIAARLYDAVGRIRLEGIFRHLDKGRAWRIRLLETEAKFTPQMLDDALATRTDGFIIFQALDDASWRRIIASGIPVVTLESAYPPALPRPAQIRLVRNDDEGIGALAAKHLLAAGNFRAFAFVPSPGDEQWSRRRQKGFVSALKAVGKTCRVLAAPTPETLAKLPLPFALYAATDSLALDVLNVCRTSEIAVPGQAAVLGTDNDEMLCAHARPSLSSIQFVTEKQGEIVALALDRLMNSPPPGPVPISPGPVPIPPGPVPSRPPGPVPSQTGSVPIPPGPVPSQTGSVPSRAGHVSGHFAEISWKYHAVVRRDSTNSVAPASQLIRRALDWIDRHATAGILVSDVVREAGVSRRLLELRFRQFEGRSIAEAIRERKFAAFCKRLKNSDEPISRLARVCGFNDLANLGRQFRARYNVSPRDWRQQHRIEPAPKSPRHK